MIFCPVAIPSTGSVVHFASLQQKKFLYPKKKGCDGCGAIIPDGLYQEIPGAARHPVRSGLERTRGKREVIKDHANRRRDHTGAEEAY